MVYLLHIINQNVKTNKRTFKGKLKDSMFNIFMVTFTTPSIIIDCKMTLSFREVKRFNVRGLDSVTRIFNRSTSDFSLSR